MKQLIPSKNSPDKDLVYTPQSLANAIVKHFDIKGSVVEPSAGPVGKQAFVATILNHSAAHTQTWYEIQEGSDFLSIKSSCHYDWSIGNWPYSIFRKFLIKNMEVADNIVTLCPTNHIIGLKARMRDIKEHGFYIREIALIERPKEWVSSGFQYAAHYLSKEKGDCKITELKYEE